MAEQDPDPPGDVIHKVNQLGTAPGRAPIDRHTYIVQIPKDQIYRVPPPENALIAARYRNPEQKKSLRICGCSPASCVGILILVVLCIAIAITLPVVLRKAQTPEFSVQQFVVSNLHYEFRLKVENPNEKSSILYKRGGTTWLSFREQKVATGKFPEFNQDPKNSKRIAVAVNARKKVTLPKVPLQLSLNMVVPVRMKLNAFKTGDVKLKVTCNLKVDKLAKGARILSQKCKTDTD